jgi:hypothetical protein
VSTTKHTRPLAVGTQWKDSRGRVWELFERLPFGRNFCRTVDMRFQGEWKTSEIREAITKATGGAA